MVAAAPIITHLYTPEDFGLLSVYSAILTMLAVIATLRYELAIPLAKSRIVAANLFALAIIILGGISSLAALLLWCRGGEIFVWLNMIAIIPFMWLLPFGAIGLGLYQILNYWMLREKKYSSIAYTKLEQGILQISVQIACGFWQMGGIGLLLGDVLGRAGGSGSLLAYMARQNRTLFRYVTWRRICWAAGRYRRFPLISSGSALLNSAGLQMPVLLLAALYGSQVAGWFGFGYRVIQIPISLIQQAVGQVFLGEIARRIHENPRDVKPLFYQVVGNLVKFSMMPMVVLAVTGGEIFAFVFGENWREAGVYIQILSLVLIADCAVSPVSHTLNLLEKQDWQMAWDAGRLLFALGGILLAYWLDLPPRYAIAALGISIVGSYVILFLLSALAIKQFEQSLPRSKSGIDEDF